MDSLREFLRYEKDFSLCFVVFDIAARPIYYVKRFCTKAKSFYQFPKINKKGMIYAPINYWESDEKAERMYHNFVVVEGVLDALKVNRIRPCVAILGKSIDDIQVKQITQLASTATMCLDADAPASNLKTFKKLRQEIPTNVIFLEKGDPNDLPLDEIEKWEVADGGVLH